MAKSDLACKARKALFKIYKCVNYPHTNVSLMTKLFDSLVKPILMYGCEVWGPSKNSGKFESKIDLMHNKFCKGLLGVNKNAVNSAVRGELGRYPIQVSINISIVKYWLRIATKNCRNLVHQAYESHFKNNKASSEWLIYVKKLLDDHGFSNVWENPDHYNNDAFISIFTQRVLDNYCQN